MSSYRGWASVDNLGMKLVSATNIRKHVCLEINFQKNAVLEQMFIDFQDYKHHSLQLKSTLTLQFKNIPEFNWSYIPRTLPSPSKSSLLVLVVSVTLLDVQGPSSLDTLRKCLCKSGPVDFAFLRHEFRSFLVCHKTFMYLY